mgnify:CR=1 FL=1
MSRLVPARAATPSLFDRDDRKAEDVSAAMDEVNAEFGGVVYLGDVRDAGRGSVAAWRSRR